MRAITIGQYTTYYNEPNLINERLNKVAAVTKEDVQRVANKYLVDTNRTVVITMPKAKAKPPPAHRDSKGVTAMRMMKTRSNIIVALILIVFVSSVAFAQGGAPQTGPGQQTTKGAVVKGKAPVNKEVLKVKLPRAEEATLKNGLQVVLLPSHKVPTFNMQLVVLSGGLPTKLTIADSRASPPRCCVKAPPSAQQRHLGTG